MKPGFAIVCAAVICCAFETIMAFQFTTRSLTTNNPGTLHCRVCSSARTLSDCYTYALCDSTLEECYMDEIITDQLTVVYNGGCRAKDVCSLPAGRKRSGRGNLIACSRCCGFENDCNRRLCGIKAGSMNVSQCYSCDHRSSEQSEVRKPEDCVTLTTCQHNEVCYTTQSDFAGQDIFFYGCLSKLKCKILMQQAFNDYKLCVVNATQPSDGLTWKRACGHVGRRSTDLCHSCCADGGCNYGTCHEMNERIFRLAMAGKFDMSTLKAV